MKCKICKLNFKISEMTKKYNEKIYLCLECFTNNPKYFLIPLKNKKPKKSYNVKSFLRILLLALYENKCMNCGSITFLNIDHIIPRSLGGTDELNNLQILCWPCNRKKSNTLIVDYRMKTFREFYNKNINLMHLLCI